MKFIQRFIHNRVEKIVSRISYQTSIDVVHYILSSIGIDELQNIIDAGKKNREIVGHSDYTNLAEVYINNINKKK